MGTTVKLKPPSRQRTVGGSFPPKASRTVPSQKQPNTTTYSGRLAQRIRTLREDSALSVDEVAAAMTKRGYEISAPTLYHWENGSRQPQLDALPYLAKALKVALGDLFPAK